MIEREAKRLGAVACGVSAAEPVSRDYAETYLGWLREGCHGTMSYMERYCDQRFDPRRLLPGARSIISLAFPYRPDGDYHHPHIADYALGEDYHRVVRARLFALASYIFRLTGAISRPCVDTAPVAERYWAHRAGLGWIGLNSQLIVPGVGSEVFLGELITTLPLVPDRPLPGDCGRCGACVKACPGRAIREGAPLLARRCHSYLTIEHKGELPAGTNLGPRYYGCDVCQRVCPHNRGGAVDPLPEFTPDPRLLKLGRRELLSITKGDWRRLVAKSAINRIKLEDLRRNLNY